jgi:two-component system chemotaxis sensor kinase CheA
VRVDLGKMDHILDLVGELAIAQAQVVAHPDLPKLQTSSLVRALAQVSRVARDLQRASLAMRMVPIKGTFDRIARIAREVTASVAACSHSARVNRGWAWPKLTAE